LKTRKRDISIEGSNVPGLKTKHRLFGAGKFRSFRFLVFSLLFLFEDALFQYIITTLQDGNGLPP